MLRKRIAHPTYFDQLACLLAGLDNTGPGEICDRPIAYSLWALGTALEHCSVEVLLAAATGLLLERLVSTVAALSSLRS